MPGRQPSVRRTTARTVAARTAVRPRRAAPRLSSSDKLGTLGAELRAPPFGPEDRPAPGPAGQPASRGYLESARRGVDQPPDKGQRVPVYPCCRSSTERPDAAAHAAPAPVPAAPLPHPGSGIGVGGLGGGGRHRHRSPQRVERCAPASSRASTSRGPEAKPRDGPISGRGPLAQRRRLAVAGGAARRINGTSSGTASRLASSRVRRTTPLRSGGGADFAGRSASSTGRTPAPGAAGSP